ncbi:MAG: trypsin-like peptidase domain-containing protein [Solirubrobacteraceae bacterium]|nr:trypsin-like peptidase domain-containing protein [Solirubrobacteraceae bacterium]
MSKVATVLVTAVVAVVAGGVGAFGYEEFIADDTSTTVVQQAPLSSSAKPSNESTTGSGLTPAAIYDKTSPGVVLISALVTETTDSVFGEQQQQGESTGTGFVVSKDGFIVTNAHVVEGAKTATVQFGEDKEIEAVIKGTDVNSDLAVLKIDPSKHDLTPLELGATEGLKVGDPVAAIGNPYGLDRTLTTGVVSALAREIQGLNGYRIRDVVQTDAAINKGNSGGPLIDSAGRVIGINSQIQSESGGNVGIGFAVPVEKLKEVLPSLEKGQEVQVPFLGVTAVEITPEVAKVARVSKGLLVAEVSDGSGAKKAGLKAGDSGVEMQIDSGSVDIGGDVILSVDGESLQTPTELQDYIAKKKVGDVVKVEIQSGSDKKTLEVTLGNRPARIGTR